MYQSSTIRRVVGDPFRRESMRRMCAIAGLVLCVILSVVSAADVVPFGEPPHLEADMEVNPTVIFESGMGTPDKTTVTLTVMGEGEAEEESFDVDVMLVLDTSVSMCRRKINDAKAVAKLFIDEMNNHDQSGLVSFASRAYLRQKLTFDHVRTKSAVNSLNCGGGSNMGDGIDLAQHEIDLNGRNDAIHVMILLTDGRAGSIYEAIEAAKNAKREGTVIFTIGLGGFDGDVDADILKEIATDHDHYYYEPDSGDLAEIYQKISNEVANIAGADVVVNYELPFPFDYLPYSFSIQGTTTGTTVRWNVGTMSIDELWSVTFEVKSHACGYLPVNDIYNTYVMYTMPTGSIDTITFPEWLVQVECPRLVDFTWSPQVPGEGSMVQFSDLSMVPDQGWITSWDWDFGDGTPHSNLQNPTHAYADDGVYKVELVVTYNDGTTGSVVMDVQIANVAPTVTLDALPADVGVDFRIAGEKWHDVVVNLYEDGVLIAEGNVTRYPGSPDEQMLHLGTLQVDIQKTYTAIVRYTPWDDPINGQPLGANPVWIILNFSDGEEIRLHHNFNVNHPDRWVWEVDLSAALVTYGPKFEATATDPGSDDLTFEWDFGDGSITTNFYPNPGGIFPITVVDEVSHGFPGSGTYVITVTVTDDDGGVGLATLEVTITS